MTFGNKPTDLATKRPEVVIEDIVNCQQYRVQVRLMAHNRHTIIQSAECLYYTGGRTGLNSTKHGQYLQNVWAAG
jgi:hypothetical protein